MALFIQALKWLKAGKKVRRAHWCKSFFLTMNFDGNVLERDSQKNFPLKFQSTQGLDWEIFEPSFCLSYFRENFNGYTYPENKVKEFIKRLKEEYLRDWRNANGKTFTLDEIRNKIDKFAGEELYRPLLT